jgi:hypothetical protein
VLVPAIKSNASVQPLHHQKPTQVHTLVATAWQQMQVIAFLAALYLTAVLAAAASSNAKEQAVPCRKQCNKYYYTNHSMQFAAAGGCIQDTPSSLCLQITPHSSG